MRSDFSPLFFSFFFYATLPFRPRRSGSFGQRRTKFPSLVHTPERKLMFVLLFSEEDEQRQ
jgi:hypothetical protein